MNKKKEILYSSNEAAKYTTGVEGWVDSGGRFWGEDEHMARYSGCTHIKCKDCGAKIPVRGYLICDDCRNKRDIEKYNNMPSKQWDGNTPLYSDSSDEYFFDEESLLNYIEDYESKRESMRLIICEPIYLSNINEDYFYDDLSGDGELPDAVVKAVDTLNKIIANEPPVSWIPGKYAVDCN